jgi:hypothetical protein
LGAIFRRLWGAFTASEVGSGALPFVAIRLLDASDLQISLLAALSGAPLRDLGFRHLLIGVLVS